MVTSGERPGFVPRPRESYLRPIPEVIVDVIPLHARRAAIRNAATSLTYGELGDYAARIAHAVLEAGIRPLDRAVLLFDHRPQALAAMLGVLQSGAIAVPLTASTPLARRDLVMRDAEPACIVTDVANEHEARALA